MALSPSELKSILQQAQRPLGIKELLRLGGIHPGQQTAVKQALRDLLRSGELEKDGKRFALPGPRRPAASGELDPTGDRVQTPSPAKGRVTGARPGRKPAVQRSEPGRRGGRAAESAVPRGGGSGRRSAGTDSRPAVPPRAGGAPRPKVLEGTLHMHRDGFGFVHPSGEGEENIYVPVDQARKALDNDRVRVEVVPGQKGRTAGRIVSVLERRRQLVVGTYVERPKAAWVEPHDRTLSEHIRVPKTQLARDGDVVKVRLGVGSGLLGAGKGLFGEVAGSLGKPGDSSVEVLSIAYAQGFNDEFPAEVMDAADAVSLKVTDSEARGEGRRDLRTLPLVTIDGEDARDFDDAIYVEPVPQGWRLVVAIADVTHYVREGTPLDAEAYHRATSVYLPDRVLPMLPERLSNGICSLKPEEDRLCMVAEMIFDRAGTQQSSEVYPGVMRSAARCTYNEVHQVLSGEDVPHRNAFKKRFEHAMALSRILTAMRKTRGSIDFDLPETKIELDREGQPARMVKRDRLESHKLVEECMLAANEAVARYCQDNKLPSVYRFHGEPDEDKLAAFAALAKVFGFTARSTGAISSKDLNGLLSQMAGHSEQRALTQLALRSMMQAVYSSENVGHYGLGAENYLHFTSPIRRYPDLLVHRLLKAHWARKNKRRPEHELEEETERLEEMAVQSSERERAAMQVEREVISFYATLLMKDRVGEEFDAAVSSLTDFGFFIELEGLFIEGLVKGESLEPDFEFNKDSYSLVFGSGRKVRVGEKLRVQLVSVNTQRRQIDFEVVQFADTATKQERNLTPVGERGRGKGRSPSPRGGASRAAEAVRSPGRGASSAGRSGAPWARGQPSGGVRPGAQGRSAGSGQESGRLASRDRGTDFSSPRSRSPQPPPEALGVPADPGADASSAHPGFDRLRALASRRGAPPLQRESAPPAHQTSRKSKPGGGGKGPKKGGGGGKFKSRRR